MEEDRFWDLVAALRVGDDVPRSLARLLARMTDRDLAGFADRWRAVKDRADRLCVVEAVTVAFGHCGDDAFSDLRDWLICQGREVCERVVAEPDSLVDVLGPAGMDDAEPVASVLRDALEHRPETKDLMVYRPAAPGPRGAVGDPADLRTRYPRCAAVRDAYLASSLPAVAVPLDPHRRTRTLSLGATWAPRRRRTD